MIVALPIQTVSVLMIVPARSLRRAQRVKVALELLAEGMTRADVVNAVAERFGVHKVTAWRIVGTALDLAGADEVEEKRQ